MNMREYWASHGLCPMCGGEMDREGCMCSGCLRIKSHQQKERSHRTKYKNESLDEICIKAKEAGLSYGKYLARKKYE